MKLTADFIRRCPANLNTLKERELSIRGHKLGAIENLGVTQDQFECIDFTDNEITKLEGFPEFKRLKTLFLSHNLIHTISPTFPESVVHIEHINLSHNQISTFETIATLTKLRNLRFLSLIGNPIASLEHYRIYIAYHIPKLKYLDFQKISPSEKREARKKYSPPKPEEDSTTNASSSSPTSSNSNKPSKNKENKEAKT
eukprot:TRINITY_DN26661_c0_g1_i1.p1 TRINITY_DN26661_c0_g1~~TRINITY_DN26661_c0_g1_i1.p1  ORF type:complete len:199 (-),score=36.19 TRINITY_DN26661_c0_g1_i1:20-616(-)